MSSSPDHVAVAPARNALAGLAAAAMLASALATPALAADFPGIGRAATDKEVAAWDIDVRPDFKGLPKGQGSVQQGQDVLGSQVRVPATASSANRTRFSRPWWAAPPMTTSGPVASRA